MKRWLDLDEELWLYQLAGVGSDRLFPEAALAKGLPTLATGIRDAVKGFQKGDAFAGSAAIMNICASLASTIGTIAGAAGGPLGALVGALFSIVSMILKMFVKEQKLLTAQIEKVIRTIKSESKIQKLHVAQQAIEAFRNVHVGDGSTMDSLTLAVCRSARQEAQSGSDRA